jgi:hypothetical protein
VISPCLKQTSILLAHHKIKNTYLLFGWFDYKMGQVLATSPLLALDDSPDDNRFSFI